MLVPGPVRRALASPYLLPALALVVVGLVFVEPLRRSDLLVFLRAAENVSMGVNPYTPTTDPFLWGGSAFVYPYLMAFLLVPLTWVPVPVADLLWFTGCGAAVVAGCRVLGLRDPLAISAVLVSSTCIRSLQVGAINTLLFLAAALAWRYRERAGVLAAAFTFLAGSKLFLLPVSVWVLLTRPRRAVVAAAGALVSFLALSVLLMPIATGEFVRSMSLLAEHESFQGMSLSRLLSLVVPDGAARPLAILVGALVLGAGALYRLRDPGRGDLVLFGAAVTASLLATPIYWSHYTVLFAAVVLAAWPTRRTAVLFALASWVLSRPANMTADHQLDGWVRITLLFVGMLAVVVALTRTRPGTAASRPSPARPTSPSIMEFVRPS